ncbi:MAG: DUF1697 domain-containing protein [Acidobacteria bacterium]|nr:DUF1697 domain-containing protein [Acidobacteriota bacterium]
MPSMIVLLRGVNVGGKKMIKMEKLRGILESLGLSEVKTYIQSGNAVCRVAKVSAGLAGKIEGAIEAECGFRPEVVVRTEEEWRAVMAANPFAGRDGVEPNKLHVHFLRGAASGAGLENVARRTNEEMHLVGREVFVYYPDGIGQTKITAAAFDKAVGTTNTARNWNTVMKLASMLLLVVACAFGEDYFPPPDAKGGWRTASPAKVGMDAAKLDEAFAYVEKTSQHGGLLVVRHGQLVYERYFGRGNREALPELASCGKAFTSLATGIMLREFASQFPHGLDEKVYSSKYLPEQYFPVDDPRKLQISLGQVLAMSAGLRGTNPVYVKGERQTWENPTADNGPYSTTDDFAMKQSLWCDPGACYSYSTSSSHVPAMIVRKITGMEMEDYMRKRLTGPLGFGEWGYAMYRPKLKGGIDANGRMLHTPGGGSIAVRATDMLRFGYLMLHEGRWGKQQVVPKEFAKMCGRLSPYNPHYSHSFNFNVNGDGHLQGVPRDAYWKGGSGGYAIYVAPSLDLVVWKLGGTESQYDPALTRLPVKYKYDGSRDGWKAGDAKEIGDATGRTLQMVVAAVGGK